MAVSKKEIEHIAKLARLGLSEKDKEKHSKDLSGILDYMKKLNEVETKNIETVSQVSGLENIFREDKNPHEADIEKIKKIISQAPERGDDFVKTRPILEK
ncbi:MAG: Asp-tRNA(Asn)/Glu-tRNA(Gln) amidotransferase subunit GatC [Parcubacteria group bacterium]|nr:Asp-tRNA(Asn)/Glu-tRNA(Gln) amidotransferase subunit GatC [Parcubacteria group bacterium]